VGCALYGRGAALVVTVAGEIGRLFAPLPCEKRVRTGIKLGTVSDVDFDPETGAVTLLTLT
jgi:hypothetical protein